jgi:hypothetical protein
VGDSESFSGLSREEQLQHWAESERQVRLLIHMLEGILDDRVRTLSLDLADHNEPGVALEYIFDFIVEHHVSVPGGVPPLVQKLAAHMEMTSRDWGALSRPTPSG